MTYDATILTNARQDRSAFAAAYLPALLLLFSLKQHQALYVPCIFS